MATTSILSFVVDAASSFSAVSTTIWYFEDLVRGFREYQIAAQSQDEGAFVASFVDAGVGSVQTIDESQRIARNFELLAVSVTH